MKNILGVNQISDLKDFYPSIFVFETFGMGGFFPDICGAAGDGTYGEAEQPG